MARFGPGVAGALGALLLAGGARAGEPVAIVGGTVHPVAGPAIPNGAVVLDEGVILEVGPADDVIVPPEATVVDATGRPVPFARVAGEPRKCAPAARRGGARPDGGHRGDTRRASPRYGQSVSRIFAYTEPTDMRKGFDGLSGIVRGEFGPDPLDGSLFLFVNRRRNRIRQFPKCSRITPVSSPQEHRQSKLLNRRSTSKSTYWKTNCSSIFWTGNS